MLDFEQLAFIEKWRQKASRGVVVALDGTRGDIIVTLRVGEGPARMDLRGQDATGAVRKHRHRGSGRMGRRGQHHVLHHGLPVGRDEAHDVG